MDTYIKLSDINNLLTRLCNEPHYQHEGENWFAGVCSVAHEITSLPVADVAEVVYAHKGLHLGSMYYCSNCGKLAYLDKYCSNCGAKIIRKNVSEGNL